jgi:FKBP-type peptidyl-prolyl cis-trans isomerase SlpA
MSDTPIGPATRVTLHFSLQLAPPPIDSGDVIDSTFERAPASFSVGDGNLLPGFERKLFGLRPGAHARFDIAPEDAFGQPNPNNVQRFARSVFAPDMELREGLVVSFADAAKAELPGVVSGFDGDEVLVDFNHPLAGRQIVFEVKILDVIPDATASEAH